MPDICDLILDDHEVFRRRFAELDERATGGGGALGAIWDPLAELLERHAAAEEEVLYPHLLQRGEDAEGETRDAIEDHNRIRDAVRDANHQDVGSEAWWDAVSEARTQNSQHMGEEERDALADFRRNSPRSLRGELGARWLDYNNAHAGDRGVDHRDKDPDDYIEAADTGRATRA